MAYRWTAGEELKADNLNRTGGVAEIVLPTDSLATINTRIANAESEGGGGVLFRSGTYNFTGDLIVKPTVSLIGESFGGAILDFGNNSAGVVLTGSDAYETGTISISSGTTVTGSGTTWSSNVTPGQKIWIRGFWYTIASVTSDTELELASPYTDFPVSGVSYAIATPFENQRIQNIFVQNSAGSAIKYEYVDVALIDGVRLSNNNISLEQRYVSSFLLNNFDIFGGNTGIQGDHVGVSTYNNYNIQNIAQQEGVYFKDSFSLKSFVGVVNNGAVDGVRLEDCYGVAWTGFSHNNGSNGFFIENSSEIQLDGANPTGNTVHGIRVENSDKTSIVQSSPRNSGQYGISIDANSTETLVSSCVFTANASGNVDDNGTDTTVKASLPVGVNLAKNTVVFEATGTYTVPDNIWYVEVELIGGGGGGGSAANNRQQGGHAGGYSKKKLTKSELGESVSITIGEGGLGATSSGRGDDGGTTEFGAFFSATGGRGGSTSPDQGDPGPGEGVGGDINVRGGIQGIADNQEHNISGRGGKSFYGMGIYGTTSGGGNNAEEWGDGGSGGGDGGNGGSGKHGVAIITEHF